MSNGLETDGKYVCEWVNVKVLKSNLSPIIITRKIDTVGKLVWIKPPLSSDYLGYNKFQQPLDPGLLYGFI